jgi:hypothetical protein
MHGGLNVAESLTFDNQQISTSPDGKAKIRRLTGAAETISAG